MTTLPKPQPRWANNRWLPILIAVISFACTAFGLELAARLLYAPQSVYREPDPVLGWRLEPNVDTVIRKPEYRTHITTNAQGWRDVEHAIAKPAGTTRILVLGDSYIEAYAVPFEAMLTQQMQDRFDATGSGKVEVLNFGVGGYGTLQEALAYIDKGVSYDPDVILLAFYAGNDLENNSPAISTALWGTDAPDVYGRPFLNQDASGEWSQQPPDYERAVKASQSRRWWEDLALYQMASIFFNEEKTDVYLSNGAYLCDPPPQFAEAWQITGQEIRMLNDAATEHGAKLVVFYVPAREEVDAKHQQKVLDKAKSAGDFCFDPSASTAHLQAILDEQGIPFINLLPVFIDSNNSGGPELFYQQDRHWNADGHALAAETLVKALRADHLVP